MDVFTEHYLWPLALVKLRLAFHFRKRSLIVSRTILVLCHETQPRTLKMLLLIWRCVICGALFVESALNIGGPDDRVLRAESGARGIRYTFVSAFASLECVLTAQDDYGWQEFWYVRRTTNRFCT